MFSYIKFFVGIFFLVCSLFSSVHADVIFKKITLSKKRKKPFVKNVTRNIAVKKSLTVRSKRKKPLVKKKAHRFIKRKPLNKARKQVQNLSKKKTIYKGKSKGKSGKNSKITTKQSVKKKTAEILIPIKKSDQVEAELYKAQIKTLADFFNTPLQKQIKQRHNMLTFNPCNFVIADLGYTGRKARTDQYQVIHFMMGDTTQNLPTAPVLHPYDPNNNTDGYTKPAYSLNVKAPQFYGWMAPSIVNAHLKRLGVVEGNVDYSMQVQDMPWAGVPLLLRPQYWLSPDEPTRRAEYYCKQFTVDTGIFHVTGGNKLLLVGQVEGQLMQENGISIHNTARVDGLGNVLRNVDGSVVVDDPVLISSNNTLALQGLDYNTSCVFYSLTVNQGRAAVVKHFLLNRQDHDVFQDVLLAANRVCDVRVGMASAKARFSNPTLVGEF